MRIPSGHKIREWQMLADDAGLYTGMELAPEFQEAIDAVKGLRHKVLDVLTWCDAQDRISKGETVTTRSIRAIIQDEEES